MTPVTGSGAAILPARAETPAARRLTRSVVLLLLSKLAALGVLYVLFFSPSHQVDVTPARAWEQLAGPPGAGTE